ncbi:hypothetical protein [Flavihumibacter fluvii]|uniref:hypothetical protein n=1 Tax=Flavihumibacter fluvii TaxID=2838157 RepID=UPI001BDE727A|nr:hypothetical protein [Flavihumibacter fluvii]ULQ53888.1 hypothetical protein KJS93_06085 [Flavihumibacter fluvii]
MSLQFILVLALDLLNIPTRKTKDKNTPANKPGDEDLDGLRPILVCRFALWLLQVRKITPIVNTMGV